MEEITLFVEKENNQMRIDKYLCEVLPEYSRSYLQKLCKESCVTVNKKEVKANYKVSEGDTVLLTLPEPKSLDISPEDIPLDISHYHIKESGNLLQDIAKMRTA